MRRDLNADRLREFLEEIGRLAKGPGRIYLTGGATALLLGWREATKDVDLSFGPEPPGVFEGIRELKERLQINIEIVAPSDFLPELPGWRERSIFISRVGEVDVFHYDLYSQALAKIERGHERDRIDVRSMLAEGRVSPAMLRDLFERVRPDLIRYPAVDEEALAMKLERALGEEEG